MVADVVLTPTSRFETVVLAAGVNVTVPVTSQSPAVRLALVQLAAVADVRDVPAVVFGTNSPTLPAFALLFVVVPTMPAVLDGVIAAENACAPDQVFAPLSNGTVAPLVPVDAVAAVPKPRFVRAAAAVVAPVPPLATATVPGSPDSVTVVHAGGLDGPVEAATCPAEDPVGFNIETGMVVAPNAIEAHAASAATNSRLII